MTLWNLYTCFGSMLIMAGGRQISLQHAPLTSTSEGVNLYTSIVTYVRINFVTFKVFKE